MIRVAEAERIMAEAVPVMSPERCPLPEAQGRILRQDVLADRDVPPFNRIMMDGVALSHAAWLQGERVFRIQEVQRPGRPASRLESAQNCIEVLTGAVLPEGCDCVVPVEQLEGRETSVHIPASVHIEAGQYIHAQGQDRKQGAVLLRSGLRLDAPHIAVLVSVGASSVLVGRCPAVAIISTGDELADLEGEVAPHQIRPSNAYGMRAALLALGAKRVDLFQVRDDRHEMVHVVRRALEDHDLLLMTGGVSMGQFDFVPLVLQELQVQRHFHKVSQRPGKPLWFGVHASGKQVFALPGNPVSSLICFYRYVKPAVLQAMGAVPALNEWCRLDADLPVEESLTQFVPVRRLPADAAGVRAQAVISHGSGDLCALADADGFVEIPPGCRAGPTGAPVVFRGW